jgi:hypothetical protein
MQIFQAMALRTIAASSTDDERKNLIEFSERVQQVGIPFFLRCSSLKCLTSAIAGQRGN